MDTKTRYLNYIDYGKSFCLFYTFLIHTGYAQFNSAIAFCMPFFFFITGFNYNPDKRNLREFILLRFKLLIVPYWLLIIFYRLLCGTRFKIFNTGYPLDWKSTISNLVYGSFYLPNFPFISEFMKDASHCPIDPPNCFILPFNCHLWFLPAMFSASIIFALLAPKFKKEFSVLKFTVTVFALLCLSSVEVNFSAFCQLPWGLGRGFYGAAIILSGFCFRRFAAPDALNIKKHSLLFFLFAAVYFLTIPLHSHGTFIITSNYGDYGAVSLFFSCIGGTCGAIALLMLVKTFDDIRCSRPIKLLCSFGRKMMWIYGLQFFFFFLVEFVYFKLGGKFEPDQFYMALIPKGGAYIIINLLQIAAAFFGGLCAAKLWETIKLSATTKCLR